MGAFTIDAQQQMRTKEPNIFAKEPHISTSALGNVARIHCPHTNMIHFPQMSELCLICFSHKRIGDSYLMYRSHARMSHVPRMIESCVIQEREYSLFYRALLQKRPVIWRSLLIVDAPYAHESCYTCHAPPLSDSYLMYCSHARMSHVPRMIESCMITNESCYTCHAPRMNDSYVFHIHRPDAKNESFPTLGASYVCLIVIVFTKKWVISHVRARMNHLSH